MTTSLKLSDRPIGIFDSGIGGLTVARSICNLLPGESIVYFGDTAHLPYGDKSTNAIREYSNRISRFLLEEKCKIIVIACNTASAIASKDAYRTIKNTPLYNVIDPVVEHVASCSPKKVAVIGTRGTINSRIYATRLARRVPKMEIVTASTPLLAPMIEEGYFNNNISKTIIRSYLDRKSFQGIDSLILGCTHYPLIKNEIQDYLGSDVEIVDTAVIVARFIANQLQAKSLIKLDVAPSIYKFYVSDYTPAFEESAKLFFGERISLLEKNIWS